MNTNVSADETPDPGPLVDRGFAVFPLPAGGRVPTGRLSGIRCLTSRAGLARAWPAGANIGVGCAASRVVVLDLDVTAGRAGPATFAQMCDRHGVDWPTTFTVTTPSGGCHLYFEAPLGLPVVSSSGGVTGFDVRGNAFGGGYVVGPGSRTSVGRYTVEVDEPVAAMPDWLADVLAAPATVRRRHLQTFGPG